MTLRTSAGLLASFLLVFGGSPALGWGQTGHRVVGEIAERRLDPTVLGEVRQLLGGEDLAGVSNWADEIRNDKRYHRGPWHYVTIEDNETIETRKQAEGGDVIKAILLNARILGDRSKTKEERGIALRWLVHLVGDIHQPLHCGRGPDRGGNTIKCQWSTGAGGHPKLKGEDVDERIKALKAKVVAGEGDAAATRDALLEALVLIEALASREVEGEANLHEIWDTHLIDMMGLGYRDFAHKILLREGTAMEQKWANFGKSADSMQKAVHEWTKESLELREEAYEKPAANKYGHYQFRDKKLPIAERRMHQAGIRLAHMINVLLRKPADEQE